MHKFKNGFILGKFLPPTNGHNFLCEFGQEQVENLTILVCSLPTESIPGELRYKWMTEMFPHARVIHCSEILPQYPEEHPDFWEIWNNVLTKYHPEPLDVIFASESYGETLAKNKGCKFVPCDIARTTFNCCGTNVRNNPFDNWNFIPDIVKPYFSKRICMAGVESTGKTTLALNLVNEIKDSVYLPEYGRTYTEFFGIDVNESDINNIVQGHLASRKALQKFGYKYIIEDTDPIMSAVWSDVLTGSRSDFFETFDDYADLYLLCDIDLPWVNDGTRYFPDNKDRIIFHKKILKELEKRNVNFKIVSGIGEKRLENALNFI